MPFLLIHLFIVAKTMLYKHRRQVCHSLQSYQLEDELLDGIVSPGHFWEIGFWSLFMCMLCWIILFCGVVEKLQADISLV